MSPISSKKSQLNILSKNKDFERFAQAYHKKEKEICILTNNQGAGASKFFNSWDTSQDFLAYIDGDTNILHKGDGSINWLVSDTQSEEHELDRPYYFKELTVYRLTVRELIDKKISKNMLDSFVNRFMIVDILEEDVKGTALTSLLHEYTKPIKVNDEKLGTFKLNKDNKYFEGKIKWLKKNISVLLEVDINKKTTRKSAIDKIHTLAEKQKSRDLKFRTYAANELTELANDWREQEDKAITKKDFLQRINLDELMVDHTGDFIAYYDDDDMFAGHVITIYGNIKKGINAANIEG